jgi:hypothetical protein
MRTYVKKLEAWPSPPATPEQARAALLHRGVRGHESGVSKGVIHKNTGARKVSRLSARVKVDGGLSKTCVHDPDEFERPLAPVGARRFFFVPELSWDWYKFKNVCLFNKVIACVPNSRASRDHEIRRDLQALQTAKFFFRSQTPDLLADSPCQARNPVFGWVNGVDSLARLTVT